MPLKTFATQAEVPEALRDSAIETKDGKFIVSEDADTSELTAAIETEKANRIAAEKLMRKTAGELQKLQTARKAADAGLTEERLNEITAEANAQAEARFKDQLDEAAKLKAQNRALVLDADMKARALKAGVRPEKIDDFWKLRADEFDLTADGKPMVKATPTAKIDEHMAALLKKNPEWVVGTKASGGGAQGSTGAGGTGKMTVEDAMKNPSALFDSANEAAV